MAPEDEVAFRWDSERAVWRPAAPEDAVELLAAESFVVEDGRARGFAHHSARFADACSHAGAGADARTALCALASVVPQSGRWFPRAELAATPQRTEMHLRLRRASEAQTELAVWLSDTDPRRAPLRKGPDLAALGELRERARAHGAEEALIADGSGHLIEGAHTSIVWWEGNALCVVPDDAAVLPGVTRRLLLEIAHARGVEVVSVLRRPGELRQREVWLTSALAGIATVSKWIPDGAAPTGDGRRLAEWRALLAATAEPLPGIR